MDTALNRQLSSPVVSSLVHLLCSRSVTSQFYGSPLSYDGQDGRRVIFGLFGTTFSKLGQYTKNR